MDKKSFIKNYNDNSDNGYLLEVELHYPKSLHHMHRDLPLLCERGKLSKSTKLITTLEDKEKYVLHISALKQVLNHGLKLKKVHRIIEFRQEAWLKHDIDMNTKLRMNAKNEFEKDFFKLMNNSVSGKTMENVRNHRDIKLVVTNERRKKLVSEADYHTCKHFSEDLMAIEMKKTKVYMNKPVYIGQAILDISKILMYESLHDYIKPKYIDKAQLCYMDTGSFILHIQTEDFYKDIAKDVKKWFDTSAYDKNDKTPLPIGINKKVIGMFKDELNGKAMTEFCALRAKTYAFRYDENKLKKKAKGTKKSIIKHKLIFDHYKDALFKNITKIASQITFKSDCNNVYTNGIN